MIGRAGWTVYALRDPEDHGVRYVGITAAVKQRRTAHMAMATSNQNKDLRSWFSDLVARGVEPVFVVLERGVGETDAEQRWIACLRANGEPLCNLSRGCVWRPKPEHVPPPPQVRQARPAVRFAPMGNANLSFGELLKLHRQRAGLTQESLGSSAGRTALAVHRHEAGVLEADGDTCAAYATALRLEGQELDAFYEAARAAVVKARGLEAPKGWNTRTADAPTPSTAGQGE